MEAELAPEKMHYSLTTCFSYFRFPPIFSIMVLTTLLSTYLLKNC